MQWLQYKYRIVVFILLTGIIFKSGAQVLPASQAKINQERVKIVAEEALHTKDGVILHDNIAAIEAENPHPPDIEFEVNISEAGNFTLTTQTALSSTGAQSVKEAKSKFDSIFALVQINNGQKNRLVIYAPWRYPRVDRRSLGIFSLSSGINTVKMWLPQHAILGELRVAKFNPPKIPVAATNYEPPIKPPAEHPRVWVTRDRLPQIKSKLNDPDNAPFFIQVKKQAARKHKVDLSGDTALKYNGHFNNTIIAKAFLYLVTNNQAEGRTAVEWMCTYINRVSFGNILDVSREISATIYTAALVYDWCYALCTPAELEKLRSQMLKLAISTECSYPPFGNSIVNGHGNESMINRDLLAMSIAIYNENPEPYKYCAYRILEELVPMRQFEYASPRHNQGVSYGITRFSWEMHAVWLMYRMCGKEVFDPNIKSVANFWLHMRLPNGGMFEDGDMYSHAKPYNYQKLAMLCYTYGQDPLLKGEFLRQGAKLSDPYLFLLLNDPELPAKKNLNKLPLAIDFGDILSSMIIRTDWNVGSNTQDTVVAEIKGGGFNARNHQHADAGAIQLYYRGPQITDLGVYHFYGTPYDNNFNKRSIAHSMLLVRDPAEKFGQLPANDGGSRLIASSPNSLTKLLDDPHYRYGKKISCCFGPDTHKPVCGYFATDLTSAYSDKLTAYTRSLCFLNLENPTHPACLIVLDTLEVKNPEFKKYWQINTHNPPIRTNKGVVLYNSENGVTGRVDVAMLIPPPMQQQVVIKSGKEVYDIFGYQVEPPATKMYMPHTKGHRIMFSPVDDNQHETFLTLIQTYTDGCQPLPYKFEEQFEYIKLQIADHFVIMARSSNLLAKTLQFTLPPKKAGNYQVVLAGLQPGKWTITYNNRQAIIECQPGEHTLCHKMPPGNYTLTPTGEKKHIVSQAIAH